MNIYPEGGVNPKAVSDGKRAFREDTELSRGLLFADSDETIAFINDARRSIFWVDGEEAVGAPVRETILKYPGFGIVLKTGKQN